MKLGNDRIVVTTITDTGARDAYGEPITTATRTLVRWCQVAPEASTDSDERSRPARTSATLIAPPRTALPTSATVEWPVTDVGDGDWRGPTWQVTGEPRTWPDCIEANLSRAEG